MEENLPIEWTPVALEKLDEIYQYLLNEWSENSANKFLDQVQQFEFIISRIPKAFIKSLKKKKYRIGLIHHYVSAIYQVQKSKIVIIALIDNRSNTFYR